MNVKSTSGASIRSDKFTFLMRKTNWYTVEMIYTKFLYGRAT